MRRRSRAALIALTTLLVLAFALPAAASASSNGKIRAFHNSPDTPAAMAARASTGTCSRWPPLRVPCPPGNCTECVASNTTGAPKARMTERARMSETRLL